jgi:hypothetical protein
MGFKNSLNACYRRNNIYFSVDAFWLKKKSSRTMGKSSDLCLCVFSILLFKTLPDAEITASVIGDEVRLERFFIEGPP